MIIESSIIGLSVIFVASLRFANQILKRDDQFLKDEIKRNEPKSESKALNAIELEARNKYYQEAKLAIEFQRDQFLKDADKYRQLILTSGSNLSYELAQRAMQLDDHAVREQNNLKLLISNELKAIS